ncbi:MAG: cytochrome c [Chloroflexi bacterium]|nr:cytochrome c [Chloroflexota bacterium]MDA8188853.1 c-type cytochrome [Dehalococcoidales bacterium]
MTISQTRNLFILLIVVCIVAFAVMSIDSVRKVSAERTPPVTEQVAAGKAVWQAKNCNDCHTILGIGGYFAPELTKVAERRDADWLKGFMTNPQKTKPGTTMPNLGVSAKEADDLVAFFQWVSKIDTNGWPPKPLVSTSATASSGAASAGQMLVRQKGCLSCHRIDGQGATGPGPDLSKVGKRIGNDLLTRRLINPRDVNPSSTMPATPLTDSERDSIVEYLSTLK